MNSTLLACYFRHIINSRIGVVMILQFESSVPSNRDLKNPLLRPLK